MTRLSRFLDALTHSGPSYHPVPRPARGDAVDTWLRGQRDQHVDTYGPTPEWYAIDTVLNRYLRHADTRTHLDQHISTEVPF